MRHAAGWRVWGMASVLLCFPTVARPQQSTPRQGPTLDRGATSTLRAGRAFLAANDLERARATLQTLLARHPEAAPAHDGIAHRRARRRGSWRRRTRRARRRSAPAIVASCSAGWWTKDPATALPPLQAAVRLQPRHAEARYYLGLTMAAQGDLEGAVAHLEAGGAYRAGAGAVAQFRELIRLSADNPQAHYQLALALQRRGATAEARAHFAEARRLSGPPPQGAR